MTAAQSLLWAVVTTFGAMGWLLYFRADDARRDYLTDISQAIHDGHLSREELRRSLGHKPVERRLNRADGAGRDER
jgi:hypothetical protein